jgi:hypothetical protein
MRDLTDWLSQAWRVLLNALCTLNRIQFEAPWRERSGKGCRA